MAEVAASQPESTSVQPPHAEAPLPQPEDETPQVAVVDTEEKEKLERVIQSDIGVSTLLNRLKQSISSAKDFATLLRKRASLEEDHAQGLKKLSRAMHDSSLRPDNRQGTFARSYDDMNKVHDRMADHGLQFSLSLHKMSDDLNELAASIERGRKHWKQNGLSAEKRVQDAELAAEKAKTKYDGFAEQYDRARTGDRQPGKFGLKGPKSAAQYEEELLRKVQHADTDYANKVQAAQTLKQELIATLRPQATNALQDLINECDSALALQMQKFASFSEKLLLGTGLSVSPLRNNGAGDAPIPKSLRDAARQVDNERDFKDYIMSHSSKANSNSNLIKYERHPTLITPQTQNASAHPKRQSLSIHSTPAIPPPTAAQSFAQMTPQNAPPAPAQMQHAVQPPQPPPSFPHPTQGAFITQSPPQHLPMPYPPPVIPHQTFASAPPRSSLDRPASSSGQHPDLPPLNPVFGVSLEDLFRRDGTAIPMIVYQCIQAVELFGLNLEGIYRLSGNTLHIQRMKALFDNDSSQVDFTNPESFYHDVNSVAGLMKQFFRELPDPLFTNDRYQDFINAARKEDDNQRRDTLHALINSLPDPNYATLRALVLHLNHVQERSSENRMNAGNIAISFGLTLMGSSAGHSIADSGWQARVIETVLQNTFQIFDDD
ncbi:Rho GTPase-activating protein [Ophidiomyces ophidiicola]|uniref:Rho GTPase-activating protein n=1 Tax=Ophidiomyces ophidiicola TaxID=1387563 RepID=A0ACB8UZU8_9EURO|nr:Rho GTPase-activating protein [Ophidiomyces ophidiicola]KAI1919809.1 Rho GTPase-activating protein [Ophidiomyces ophidiicola]KAI1929029.1 Rho GTPase-activating protein [Ophidiomyces ophidiicola]KAI1950070.1 Rho GTPase-activating protein [Ophidiomyces ophidiicola]KAI1959467.1 Rho GTPase-activating protein [Ophidiomyces ophidiicola]